MPNKMNRLIENGTRVLGNYRRTSFPRTDKNYITFNAGKLIPVFCKNMEPYQRYSCKRGGSFIRALTPIGAVMDSAYLDLFAFFVPNRLLWDHWEDFITGVNQKDYTSGVTYSMPKIKYKASAYPDSEDPRLLENRYIHSFLDYLPRAVDVVELSQACDEASRGTEEVKASYLAKINNYFSIDALYPRAAVKIWNDWFRDEFIQDSYELYTGDNDEYADEFAFNLLDAEALLPINKLHTIATDARPEPYNGEDTLIPMNNLVVGGFFDADDEQNADIEIPYLEEAGFAGVSTAGYDLVARNVSNTIRQLGVAYKTEYLLQKDLNGGNRYVEQILTHWGISNSDRGMNRSQFIAWRRIGLDTYQVTNTAKTSSDSLGVVGGQQVLRDSSFNFAFEAPEQYQD